MALSHSLATTTVICCLAASATAVAQSDQPSIEDSIQSIETLGREAMRLKEESRWKEYHSVIAKADALHQRVSKSLAGQRQRLDESQQKLDDAIHQFERPQIMVQAVLAVSQDLDDAVLNAACTRVSAQAVNGDPARNIEPSVYSMSSDQAGKLLAAIEKRRPIQVISRPSILAVDGQVAEIAVGQPVKTQIATRDGTGEVKIQPGVENIGLSVSLTPTIENDHQTRISLIVKNSSLAGSAVVVGAKENDEVITSPVINSEKLETTIQAAEGRTILVALRPFNIKIDGKDQPERTTLVFLTPRVVERTADAGEIMHH